METLAEQAPQLLPSDLAARMHARSIISEMHSGFSALRGACPMNIRGRAKNFPMTDDIFADICRVQDLLEHALEAYGGTFLYGDDLTAADAFYAPVMYRLRTYAPPAHCELADYSARLLAHPWLLEWEALGQDEPPIKKYDQLLHP